MAFKPSSDLTVAPSTSGGQVRAGGGLRAAHSRPLRDAPSVVPAGEFSRNPRAVARCRFIAPAYLPRRFREERSAVFLFLLCFVRRKFGFVFRFLGAYPRDFVRSKRGDNLLNLDPSTSACTEYGQSALSYLRSAPTHPPYSCALFASTAVAPEMEWGSDAGGGGGGWHSLPRATCSPCQASPLQFGWTILSFQEERQDGLVFERTHLIK